MITKKVPWKNLKLEKKLLYLFFKRNERKEKKKKSRKRNGSLPYHFAIYRYKKDFFKSSTHTFLVSYHDRSKLDDQPQYILFLETISNIYIQESSLALAFFLILFSGLARSAFLRSDSSGFFGRNFTGFTWEMSWILDQDLKG
jgi:hypothetical protein